MNNTVLITIFDEVKCMFQGIAKHHHEALIDHYAVLTEYYRYNTDYILGDWDGKIRFFYADGRTFVYLMPDIIKKLKRFGYTDIRVADKRQSLYYDVVPDVDVNYFQNITNPKTGNPYQLLDHQIDAANKLITAGSGIALAGTGFGKAQPLSCKVMTPYGWTSMGSIEVGDLVVTPKNTITRVLEVFDQGVTDVYKITLQDGGVTYAHGEHLWTVVDGRFLYQPNTTKYITLSTLEIKNKLDRYGEVSFGIPLCLTAIDLPPAKLQFDPYIVGSILPFCEMFGEHMVICAFQVKSKRDAVAAVQRELYESYGFKMVCYNTINDSNKFGSTYRFKLFPQTEDAQALFDYVYSYASSEYKIPDEYLFCAAEQRLAFIRGMCNVGAFITSQGIVNLGLPNIAKLREQIIELIVMQGGCPHKYGTRYVDEVYCILKFGHEQIPDLFITNESRLEQFRNGYNRSRAPLSNKMREIKSIEQVEKQETRCIYIEDNDHLYITDYAIITHNTILNAALVDKYNRMGCKTVTIVPSKSLITQTVKQFNILKLNVSHFSSANPSLEYDHIVTTWQTLKNYPTLISKFQMVVVDECFAGHTNIRLSNGETKHIKDIQPNDEIISYNIEESKFEQDIVVKCHENILKSSNEKMYQLEFDNGEVLEVTGNHLFLTNMGYIRADELTDEHDIIDIRGYDDTVTFAGTTI
jgi:hypothetical protein